MQGSIFKNLMKTIPRSHYFHRLGGCVLDSRYTRLSDVIGKKVIRDVFSSKGVLLIPAQVVILEEHIEILSKHGIQLSPADLVDNDDEKFYDVQQEMDRTVEQATEYFNEIRLTKKIPLADIRQDILPIIHEASKESTLYQLFTSLQAKDDYTYRHNIAVGTYAGLIGNWLGMGRQELLQLTTAALLHDVGKMLVAEEILHKPGKLSDEEFEEMKKHTVYGYELLKETTGITHRQALVALQHHERMDGRGYPHGLKGDQIDLFSRIVAVADVFHAMTSMRVYREPSPFYQVLAQMDSDSFGVLDPQITNIFIQKLMSTLIGQQVTLTDERQGTILLINAHNPIRPLIKTEDDYLDLSKDFSVHIHEVL